MRAAGLVRIGGAKGRAKVALIDVKEAVPAFAPPAQGVEIPSDHAEGWSRRRPRPVAGVGERMIAAPIGETR